MLFVGIFTFKSYSQRLPQIQQVSVRAPENIKIDGVLNEWSNKFLVAYNSANRIYYAISNDDENLYITMRGLGTRVAIKALVGGITITISHSLERKSRTKDKRNVTLIFPVPQADTTISHVTGLIRENNLLYDDDKTNRKKLDSIEQITNTRMSKVIKELKVFGVKEIEDTTISVYNTLGIKAMAQFTWRQPVFEIAIPLKYLNLAVGVETTFSYNIKLTGEPFSPSLNGVKLLDPTPDNMYIMAPTDFWGEYTLAKKP